jgi:hypothetical protein
MWTRARLWFVSLMRRRRTFAATAAALGIVAGAAALLPAWRAAGMDPADILNGRPMRRRGGYRRPPIKPARYRKYNSVSSVLTAAAT